jgi:hypothetical protein
LPPKPCTLFFPLPCVPHAPSTSLSLTWYAQWCLEMSTNYKVPHCVTSSMLILSFLGPNILLRTQF